MDSRMPTVELIRELWAERFPKLSLPEDFIRSWVSRRTLSVISAFNTTRGIYRRCPDKTALDIAKIITADLRKNHIAHEIENRSLTA